MFMATLGIESRRCYLNHELPGQLGLVTRWQSMEQLGAGFKPTRSKVFLILPEICSGSIQFCIRRFAVLFFD